MQLAPSTAALEARIAAPSRIGTNKVIDPAFLRQLMSDFDLRTPATGDDLIVDNTDLPAEAVAVLVAERVGLRPVGGESPRPVKSEHQFAFGDGAI